MSRARPALLAAALLAATAYAGGATQPPKKSLPSLYDAVGAICSKDMNKDFKKALSQQEGKQPSKEEVKKALSQQCDALSTLVLASPAEKGLTKATRKQLEASRASSIAGNSRTGLTSTDFIRAVDALYLPLQVYSDQKNALANVIIDVALNVPVPAEKPDEVALRRGILWMLRSDKEGAKEEFRRALKENPKAALPPSYARTKMGDVLEDVRNSLPPKPPDVGPKDGPGTGSPVAGGPVAGGPVAGGPVTGGPVTGGPVAGGPTKTAQGASPWPGVAVGAGVGLLVGGGWMGKQAYDYHQAERLASAAGDYDAYEKSRGQALMMSVLADTCYLAGAVSAAWGLYSLLKPAPNQGSLSVTPGVGSSQALLVSGRF